jgi:hypothetical protein
MEVEVGGVAPPSSRWRSAESSDSLRTSAPTFRRCDGGRGAANRDAVSDASARSSGPRWARRTRRPTGCPISFSRRRRGHGPHLLHLPPRTRPDAPPPLVTERERALGVGQAHRRRGRHSLRLRAPSKSFVSIPTKTALPMHS